MRVLASRTCDGAGDIANRLVEALRQIEHFASRGKEDRRNSSTEALFSAFQSSTASVPDDRGKVAP